MSSFSGQAPAGTYYGLMQIPGGVSASLTTVQDGTGTSLPFQLSTTILNVTGTLKVSGNTIPYQVSANKLLGSTTGSTAAIGEVSIGTGLSLSSGTLSATVSSAPAVTIYTSGSGTYTPTAGMVYIRVRMVGAGGGGGGVSNAGNNGIGGGGSAGGYLEFIMTAAQVGANKSYSVGTKGTGATAGNNNGTAGGDTTFGDWTAGGGGRGLGMAGSASTSVISSSDDSTSNTVGTGTVIRNITGNTSNNVGAFAGLTVLFLPSGAGSILYPYGTSLYKAVAGGSANGTAATSTDYGCGGSGGYSIGSAGNRSGGDGANGVIIIEEYF